MYKDIEDADNDTEILNTLSFEINSLIKKIKIYQNRQAMAYPTLDNNSELENALALPPLDTLALTIYNLENAQKILSEHSTFINLMVRKTA